MIATEMEMSTSNLNGLLLAELVKDKGSDAVEVRYGAIKESGRTFLLHFWWEAIGEIILEQKISSLFVRNIDNITLSMRSTDTVNSQGPSASRWSLMQYVTHRMNIMGKEFHLGLRRQ